MPSTQASSYRSPQTVRRRQSTTPRRNNVKEGCILSLPRKEDIEGSLLTDAVIHDGCFHHSVVILSTEPTQGKATILILTSFDGLDLMAKYPRNRYQRDCHLPIAPNAVHPDRGILLLLEDEVELRKKSYIKTEHQYIVQMASMIPYCHSVREFKLQQASFDMLKTVAYCSQQVDPFGLSRHLSISSPDFSVARQTLTGTTRPVAQIRSISHIPASSGSVGTIVSQANVSPASHRDLVFPNVWQDPNTYNDPNRNGQGSLPPCKHPSSTPSPPEPNSSSLAAFVIPLIFLGSVGAVTYGCCRLLDFGRGTWREIKGKWTDTRFTSARVDYSKLIGTISKASVSAVRSLEDGFHSIRTCTTNYRRILSHLVERTLSLDVE